MPLLIEQRAVYCVVGLSSPRRLLSPRTAVTIVSRCVGFRHADHFPLLVDAGGSVIVTAPDVASTSATSPVAIDADALSTRIDICLWSRILAGDSIRRILSQFAASMRGDDRAARIHAGFSVELWTPSARRIASSWIARSSRIERQDSGRRVGRLADGFRSGSMPLMAA